MEKTIKEILQGKNGIPVVLDNIDREGPQVEQDPNAELAAYWKKVMQPTKSEDDRAKIILSRNEILNVISNRGFKYLNNDGGNTPYVIDQWNEDVIEILGRYFLQDDQFESMGKNFSLKKGIMLQSEAKGSGKTLLMKLFSTNGMYWNDGIYFNSYTGSHVINCRKIISEYRKDGDAIYEKYCEKIFATGRFLNDFMFDELGREDHQVLYFGNRTNVMEKILADRYDLFVDEGIKTHITTNIMNGNDIEKIYGDYIRSRMREMFNVIELPGSDRRK